MALYRNISMTFWTDPKVDDEFTPEDKYFYLYLLTNPHTNICGCYEISMKQMVRETGYNEDTINRLLKRMETAHKVIQYDRTTKEILIVNWSKYNWSASDKVTKAVLNVAERIKSTKFKELITALINNTITTKELIQNTDTVTDTVTDTDTVVSIGYTYPIDTISKTHSKRFNKPSLDEVKAYCQERGNGVNAERFIDYYESNGWKVGKNPMKDWKAAVRTWERNGFDSKPKEEYHRPTEEDYDFSDWM